MSAFMILSGNSIDSSWDEVLHFFKTLTPVGWAYFVGSVILVVCLIYFIARYLKNKFWREHEMSVMEKKLMNAAEARITIAAYVREARGLGASDDNIRKKLEKAGWDKKLIEEGLSLVGRQ